jgi:Tfp pilus assembly protein PilX
MKTKFFFLVVLLVVLFMGISAFMYAQSQATAPAETKDVKSTECSGHAAMGAKADCKWVDADGDGKCDTCKKTEKECKEACAPKAATTTTSAKSGCASTCPHAKDCGKPTGTAAPAKEGDK